MLQGLLFLLPALALVALLLARRYPGERIVLALRAATPRRRRLRPPPVAGSRGRRVIAAVSGGRLIGCSLAVRPPPASLPAS